MENTETDIVDQIDDVIEPGPDAATWYSDDDSTLPDWSCPEPDRMLALHLEDEGGRIIDISRTSPGDDIARIVGDPAVDRLALLPGVTAWVGDNSHGGPINRGTTHFFESVLRDAASGAYAVSDAERESIAKLLETPGALPVVHGPCVVTGTDGRGPGPLPESFQQWVSRYVARGIAHRHAHALWDSFAALGVHVVVVDLDADGPDAIGDL